MPEVSIMMTAHKRTQQLRVTLESLCKQTFKDFEVVVVEDGNSDEGRTEVLCSEFNRTDFPVRYFQRTKRSNVYFSNPAVPNNIGLRQCRGDIVVIQNAENYHSLPDNIEKLVQGVRDDRMSTLFASVAAMKADGTFGQWYTHSVHSPRPLYFCQALAMEHVRKMRGFDEDYKYYGFDDNDFADRLAVMGVKFVFRDDIEVIHQWHASTGCAYGANLNQEVYERKTQQLRLYPESYVRNEDREWGVL